MLNYQHIILWRHADAEKLGNENVDTARPLSKKGEQQAQKMAKWLVANLPAETLVISSNAVRAQQTAEALKLQTITFANLAPTATLQEVLATISELADNHLHAKNLLIIGHQPWLGLLAAQLLCLPNKLTQNSKEISIKKGSVWWFKKPNLENNQAYKLFTVQVPSLI